ncbi:MAG TPA: SRPBCC family protein [Longimicrobium sp.]|nr:SRPBCC family protein [Longimicrobium sp.]
MHDPESPRTLPVSWYSDPAVLEAERRTVLAAGPQYVGSVPMVPEHGWFRTVPQRDHGEVLVREGERVRLVSNVCLHRGFLMTKGRGRKKAIVCPMHRWSYDLAGGLLKAPHYPETPCLHLPRRDLQDWNGILFAGGQDVAGELAPLSGLGLDLDVRNYVLEATEEEEQPFNWKIPIEVLLENYHAPYIHPGFTRFADPATWLGNDGAFDSELLMFQVMRPHPDFAHNPASRAFEEWQRAILELTGGQPPRFAAVIALYRHNTIIEWWPFTFQVTTYVPRSPGVTLMTREFCFDPRALVAMPEYPELARAAWYETQRQDEEAHASLQVGRALAHRRDPHALTGYEVYQSPMEDSVQLFHSMLIRDVSPHLAVPGRAGAARAGALP